MNRIYKFPQDVQENYFLRLYCFLSYAADRMKGLCSVKHRTLLDVPTIYTASYCRAGGRGRQLQFLGAALF